MKWDNTRGECLRYLYDSLSHASNIENVFVFLFHVTCLPQVNCISDNVEFDNLFASAYYVNWSMSHEHHKNKSDGTMA